MPSRLLERIQRENADAIGNSDSSNSSFVRLRKINPVSPATSTVKRSIHSPERTEPTMAARENIVLELKGRIVADSVDILESEISAQLGNSPTLAILDFSRVDEIGSAAVGLFIALQKRLRALGGDLILSSLRPRHQNFLDTLGFRNYFSVALDVETAIEYTGNLSRIVSTLTVSCPFCGSLAESDGPGRGRCRVCHAVYTVMDDGSVELG